MAMGLYIYNKLVDENASADGQAVALANLQKLGQAIVEYITANAQVTVTVTVATTGTATAQSGTASRNWWRVFIKDLKIKRDKSNPQRSLPSAGKLQAHPLAFKYTLEMAAVEEESSTASGILSTIADAVEAITDVAETLEDVLSGVEGAMAALNEVASCASNVKAACETMQNRSAAENVLNITAGLLGSAQRILGGGSGSSLYNSAKDLLAANSTLTSLFNSETSGEAQSSKVEATNKHTVSFEAGGGSAVSPQTALLNGHPAKPENPAREGYESGFWSMDAEGANEFFFGSTLLTKDRTLYAQWGPISWFAANKVDLSPQSVLSTQSRAPSAQNIR